jgi:hypothetical protein
MASSDATPTAIPAALCLPTTMLIIGRLIDWRDRWNRT